MTTVRDLDAETAQGKAAIEELAPRVSEAAEGLAKAPLNKPKKGTGRTTVLRSFAAPIEANSTFLIEAGELVSVRDPNSPSGSRDHSRRNDVTVTFHEGIVTTEDPKVIKWCEEHPDICRDVMSPQTEVWFKLKQSQRVLSNAEPTLPPEVDVDAFMRGDVQDFGPRSPITLAREQLEAANG